MVVFSEAATDDPPRTRDPGLEEDVADCRAQVKAGTTLSLSILNGYPGYACRLQIDAREPRPGGGAPRPAGVRSPGRAGHPGS